MMKTAEKYFKVSCILILIILLAVLFQRYPFTSQLDQSQNFKRFESNWECGGEIIRFPYMLDRNTETTVITNVLPEVKDGDKLILRDSYKGLRVYVNQQLIYEYMTETKPLERLRGDLYLYVPLSADTSNQPIRIELLGELAAPGGISSIRIGDAASFIISMRAAFSLNYIILVMMFMFGFGLLGIAAYLDLRKKEIDYRSFFNLGIFSLITAVWIWTDSPFYHINISNAVSLTVLSFISFMAIPLPIAAFVESICVKPKQSLRILSCGLFLNILLQSLLYVLGCTDFIQLLPLTHLLMIISVILMTLALIEEIKANNSMIAKGFLLALSILVIFSFITLIQFYINPFTNGRSLFMLGFILFIVILAVFSVKRVWLLYEQNTKLKLYQNMAYSDMMTMAQNRTAFSERIARLSGKGSDLITLLILDINNLKQVNDQFGHQEGDRMIIEACKCILAEFGEIADVYRIGGDEFAVLITERTENMKDYLKRLDTGISSYNKQAQHSISLAYGYASGNMQTDIEVLFKQADKNMYLRKFEQKKRKGE